MASCLNCKKTLSCGCQKRTSSDGKSVCTSCLQGYEARLKQNNKVASPESTTKPAPVWRPNGYKKQI